MGFEKLKRCHFSRRRVFPEDRRFPELVLTSRTSAGITAKRSSKNPSLEVCLFLPHPSSPPLAPVSLAPSSGALPLHLSRLICLFYALAFFFSSSSPLSHVVKV